MLSLFPTAVEGARFFFEPSDVVLGTEGNFIVTVFLDTEGENVNAVSTTVSIPTTVEVARVHDNGSVVTLWVQAPVFEEATRTLSLSGLIPGGFSSPRGRLLRLELAPTGDGGTTTLSFKKADTAVLAHAETPTKLAVIHEPLSFMLVPGKENTEIQDIDSVPPLPFTPMIARHSETFDGKYFIVFSTSDEDSGMCCYYIAEVSKDDVGNERIAWEKATSPHVLRDQTRRSVIYVKALDTEGNEYVAIHEPRLTAFIYQALPILGILLLVSVMIVFLLVYMRKRQPGNRQHTL